MEETHKLGDDCLRLYRPRHVVRAIDRGVAVGGRFFYTLWLRCLFCPVLFFPRWYMACTNLLYTVALFFAFWLFGQSYFVIQVLCPWCLLITLTTTLVFGGITRINIRDGVIPFPHSVRRFVSQGLDWALWGLIVFGVLAMVAAKYGLKLLG